MPHFFIKSEFISENKITIPQGDTYKHLKNALRIRLGEELMFVDENKIQYETKVLDINNNYICAEIIKNYPSTRFIEHALYLAQSVLKTDAMNYAVQKATELGIKGIYPIMTDNSVIKKSVAAQKIPHMQKIAYEAAKQCERPDIPPIFDVVDFDTVINNSEFRHIFCFVERESALSLKQAIAQSKIKKENKILLIIGPEGGFSENEFKKMDEHAIKKVTLGNLILRADTAATVAIANTIHELEH